MDGRLMVHEGDRVAIFNSIHRVMKAEKLLKEARLDILLIPAPRTLHADCGLALRYGEAAREGVEKLFVEADLSPDEIYLKTGDAFRKER